MNYRERGRDMKRRITKSDLEQLSIEQKEKLFMWYVPNDGDIVLHEDNNIYTVNRYTDIEKDFYYINDELETIWVDIDFCLPLLDIGQMIELLQDNRVILDIWDTTSGWNVGEWIEDKTIHRTELCDALWQAVKSIL